MMHLLFISLFYQMYLLSLPKTRIELRRRKTDRREVHVSGDSKKGNWRCADPCAGISSAFVTLVFLQSIRHQVSFFIKESLLRAVCTLDDLIRFYKRAQFSARREIIRQVNEITQQLRKQSTHKVFFTFRQISFIFQHHSLYNSLISK